LYDRTKLRQLCLAGGCALNSVANGKLTTRSPFEQVYVPPIGGDAGGSIGAAYAVWNQVLGRPRSFVMHRADWGPSFATEDIRSELDRRGASMKADGWVVTKYPTVEAMCARAAEEIASGKIMGWFQGRMELGARALGQRSILADPRRADMKDILNSRIKRREAFRPFAPSILEEAVGEYFEGTQPSPFMTMTYQVREEKRSIIPAPTHVDGSGRVQTVNRHAQPVYWQLISAFAKITGVPVVLNTSFNEHEPIVCTPREAVDCLLRTKMDGLAIGPFVVTRA
jgi:carbamoyltransferase